MQKATRVLRWAVMAGWAVAVTGYGRAQKCPQTPAQPTQAAVPTQTSFVDDAALDQMAELMQSAGPESASASTNDAGPAGIVPYTKGFNASMVSTGQHDSGDGWSALLVPTLAYRFDRHWSLTLAATVYPRVNVSTVILTNKKKTATTPATTISTSVLVDREWLLGDTQLGGGFEARSKWFDYQLSGLLAMPTGDDADGLGAGQFTYSFNNHFERQFFGWLTPELELGIGDSPNLDDTRVHPGYDVTGTNAHFQAGFGFDLPWKMNFTTDAYEDLPLAAQTLTTTTTNGKKGKQLKIITTTSQESIGEDNGFLNTLDIPWGRHLTLSGFYNRSLRNKTDTAGMSVTLLLRGVPKGKDEVH